VPTFREGRGRSCDRSVKFEEERGEERGEEQAKRGVLKVLDALSTRVRGMNLATLLACMSQAGEISVV